MSFFIKGRGARTKPALLSLLSIGSLCSLCFASCATSPLGPHERIGPLLVELPADAAEEAEETERTVETEGSEAPYNIFSMVFSISRGMFYRLDLQEMLTRQERLQLLQRFFYRETLFGREREIKMLLPDYFEKGDLEVTLSYHRDPPERFEWKSNALLDPFTGKALKKRGRYVEPSGLWRNVGETVIVKGEHLVREINLYSKERERELRAEGELLILAHTDILDEKEHTDRRGKMIIDGILSTPGRPYGHTASAYCGLVRYHLKYNNFREAEKALEAASRLCSDGPEHLRTLYENVQEEYRLSTALLVKIP